MDVWSRRIVGWQVAARESADIAAELIRRTCRDGNRDPQGLVLHSDNGAPMRSNTMISTLQWLGVVPSFSRPHVSSDNPYSEALFRALKYVPSYPRLPSTSFGDMNLGLNISYVTSFDVQNTDGSTFDGLGSRNFTNQFSSMPELRANAMFGWSNGGHSVNMIVRYIDSNENDQNVGYTIDSWTAVDVRYNFQFEMISDQQTRLTIGARNSSTKIHRLWAKVNVQPTTIGCMTSVARQHTSK